MLKQRKKTRKQSNRAMEAKLFNIQSSCKLNKLYALHVDREFVFYDIVSGKVLSQCSENERNWYDAIRRAIARRNERLS